MAYNPYRTKGRPSFTEEVDELKISSGSQATIVQLDSQNRTIFAKGCLVDMLLLKAAASHKRITVQRAVL